MSDAAALKDAGNKAFAAKQYNEAIEHFTKAIELDGNNHVLWSNRSAAKAGLKDWKGALEDADQIIKVNPKWSKGYARRGAALHGAHRYAEAITAYEEGIIIEDSPALQKGLKEVKDARAQEEAAEEADMGGIGKMFSDPNLIGKLASNPKTQPLLADPAFVAKLQAMQTNPALASNALQDPRMIQVLGVLMGIDMQGFERPEGSNELPPGVSPMSPSSASTSSPTAAASSAKSAPPPAAPGPKKDEPMEDVEETEEDKQKKEALELKAKGSDAYRKRDFGPAAENFQKAWDLWPKDITFLTNLAAVQFEAGDYDATIATCKKAVEHGRELRADYKIIAKAFGRVGSAYMKKDDMDNAVKFFSKSLSEHRTPDILNKLRDCEKMKKERDARAYINPEEAEKAREEGNARFKAGDFAGAVASYTEAIKRSPDDPRGYNNRSNAYTKLMAFPEALKDAEKAIEVDPKFIKAYIRKSVVLCSMREFTKAMEAAQQGSDHDVDQKHTAELEAQMQKCATGLYGERSGETEEETLARAMRDPEVAKIMQDPIMQQILQQAQSDPASLQDHMKNPQVRANIQKLVAAGIIKTR
ncbi:Hsp90 cochaperone [Tulasnella sp. JGI-2019a]|nr:Hsp90 cochaperone [Tulasnella sp. JGI-2019a]